MHGNYIFPSICNRWQSKETTTSKICIPSQIQSSSWCWNIYFTGWYSCWPDNKGSEAPWCWLTLCGRDWCWWIPVPHCCEWPCQLYTSQGNAGTLLGFLLQMFLLLSSMYVIAIIPCLLKIYRYGVYLRSTLFWDELHSAAFDKFYLNKCTNYKGIIAPFLYVQNILNPNCPPQIFNYCSQKKKKNHFKYVT